MHLQTHTQLHDLATFEEQIPNYQDSRTGGIYSFGLTGSRQPVGKSINQCLCIWISDILMLFRRQQVVREKQRNAA